MNEILKHRKYLPKLLTAISILFLLAVFMLLFMGRSVQ